VLTVLGLVRKFKPVADEALRLWLEEFRKKGTRSTYCAGLRKFKELLGIVDLGEYLVGGPDAVADLRRFLVALDGKPAKTVSTYATAVRVFLLDHDVALAENDWRKMRRRGFVPKRVKALTRDKKPSKVMLRKILNYADIKLRALTLFLLSSGCRIGETLQLRVDDFDFDSDPPRVRIRGEITKGGIGERTAYFSYEARDAIHDWLHVKGDIRRRDGKGTYGGDVVFPFSSDTARFMWNSACERAGYGGRDSRTGRRVYHLHSLRKFFRSNVGLELDVIHALMGHGQYLDDAYLRLEEEGEIAKQYLSCMGNVSVYAVEDLKLRERTEMMQEENVLMRKELECLRQEMAEIRAALKEKADWKK